MSPWARASALHRHLECPAASWLPRAERGQWHSGYLVTAPLVRTGALLVTPDDDSVMADWGTAMHLAKEDLKSSADPWRSWMEPHRETLWPTHLGQHEVPWSYDCRTGRIEMWHTGQGDADEWKKSRGATCVTGTTDWLGALPAGEPWVDDLKTGWPVPALTTPQMLMYALMAARRAESQTVRISVTHWRRGWEEPERRWQQVGPATLEAFEDEVRVAWRRAASGPEARPGLHCRYCPSSTVCPAVIGDVQDQ